MRFGIAVGLASALGLAACAPQMGSPAPVIVDAALRSELDQQIAQNGAEAAAALRQLASMQRVRTPAPSPAVADADLPQDLRTKATFEWSGPVGGLVKEMAGRIGYAYRESGNPPAILPFVNVSLREVSVGQAFADVGLQVQRSATIIVDPSAKLVELRYEAARAPVDVIRDGGSRGVHRTTAHRVRHVTSIPGK